MVTIRSCRKCSKYNNFSICRNMLYYIVYPFWYLVSLLPLGMLYAVSDALYPLVYHIGRYRRKIVRKNLTLSFPERGLSEIIRIEKAYYRWFCDYIVESLKMLSMPKDEMMRRMQFEGCEQIEACFDEGHPVSVYLGHYCNWEWITSLPLHVRHGICAQIYHPIENKKFDELFLKLRGRFGAVSIAKDDTLRAVLTWKREKKMNVIGYIADQVPGLANVHLWVDFLHHDTPVFSGAEKITVKTHADVFYADIVRTRRGYYRCTFRPMKPEGEYQEFFYTKEYFRLLEQSIQKVPQYWLWSHNRWKRTREQFNRDYNPEEQAKMLAHL